MRISRVGIAWIALAGVAGPALPGRARAAASAPAAEASQGDLPQLWRRLTTENPVEAEQAVRAMAKAGDRAVTFLAPRLEPSRADAGQIRRWIAELGSQRYAVRQEAFRGLASLGEAARPALVKARESGKLSAEAKVRVDRLLAAQPVLVPRAPEARQAEWAVAVLQHVGTEPARRVLRRLASGAAAARLTRRAQAALGLLRDPSVAPAAGEHEPVRVAAWSAILDDDGIAAQLRAFARPVRKDTTPFQAYVCDGELLLELLRVAKASGHVLMLPRDLDWHRPRASSIPRPGHIHLHEFLQLPDREHGRTRHVLCSLMTSHRLGLETAVAAARLTLDCRRVEFRFGVDKLTGTLQLRGTLAAGQALVVLGRIAQGHSNRSEVVHGPLLPLAIWQAVPVRKGHGPYVEAFRRTESWIGLDQRGFAELIEEGLAWQALAKSLPPAPPAKKWTRSLPGGVRVQLVGLTQAKEHVFRWWDPDGRPIAFDTDWCRTSGAGARLCAVVRIHHPEHHKPGQAEFCVTPVQKGKVDLGVGLGTWTVIGRIARGRPLKDGGTTYTLDRVRAIFRKAKGPQRLTASGFRRTGLTSLHWKYDRRADLQVDVVAMHKDGREVRSERRLELRTVRRSMSPFLQQANIRIDIDDVDHFLLRKRPVHWVTFDGFAEAPVLRAAPPGAATPPAAK